MPSTPDYLNYVLEQLAGVSDVTSRRMFGGWGLYSDEIFFALIFQDTLYFKVGDANRSDYESRGMRAFRPYADREQISLSYYEVPADALEDGEQLKVWAHRSIEVALAAAATKPARRTRRKVSAKGRSKRKVQSKAVPKGNRAVEARPSPPVKPKATRTRSRP